MLLTEEEAREKWCPQLDTAMSEACCIASKCMAWRLSKDHYTGSSEQLKEKGFCGLAGRVE